MSVLPSALLLVNDDLTDSVENMLVRQLFISTIYDGYDFDSQISNNPTFLSEIKAQQQRVMVIRPFNEVQNRQIFDVVLFIKAGLASVLRNNFGPPGFTLPVVNLYWNHLGVR